MLKHENFNLTPILELIFQVKIVFHEKEIVTTLNSNGQVLFPKKAMIVKNAFLCTSQFVKENIKQTCALLLVDKMD